MVPWPELFSERVHVIAQGERFEVDGFLVQSILRPVFVWRRGAPLTSDVEVFLGDGRALEHLNFGTRGTFPSRISMPAAKSFEQ
jgi:hypothetical protein